jgi:hypothetical protein
MLMSDRRWNWRRMRNILVPLVACLCLATPCLAAPDGFVTDKPSPLKPAKPGKGAGAPVQFRGQVQISGRFQVGWESVNRRGGHLRAAFFPDRESIGLLPHASGGGPVDELLFSNAEQAVSILLDQATAQRILAKDLLDAAGEATVTIRDYRTVVECDHRWYLAHLVSVARNENIVVGAREKGSGGC